MSAKVSAKLANMRKPQEFSVRPTSDGRILIQSDKSTGMFDFRTGEGVLNTKGCYFPHLAVAAPYTFPAEFVRACLDACPALDSTTTIGRVHMANTVQMF